MPRREIPPIVNDRLEAWKRYKRWWRMVYWGLGGAAIVCSVLVASRPERYPVSAIGWVVAAATTVLVFIGAGERARAYKKMCRRVETECLHFREDPAYPEPQLIHIVESSEAYLQKTDV